MTAVITAVQKTIALMKRIYMARTAFEYRACHDMQSDPRHWEPLPVYSGGAWEHHEFASSEYLSA